MWQSQILSSLIFPPYHATQNMNLSKQGPNQAPTPCGNFWSLPINYKGQKPLIRHSKLFPLFLFFCVISNCTPPYTNLFSQPRIPTGSWTSSPPHCCWIWHSYPLLATLCILIIFQSTTWVPPPSRLGLETSFKPHWCLYMHPSFHLLPLMWHWCFLTFLLTAASNGLLEPHLLWYPLPLSAFTEAGSEYMAPHVCLLVGWLIVYFWSLNSLNSLSS